MIIAYLCVCKSKELNDLKYESNNFQKKKKKKNETLEAWHNWLLS